MQSVTCKICESPQSKAAVMFSSRAFPKKCACGEGVAYVDRTVSYKVLNFSIFILVPVLFLLVIFDKKAYAVMAAILVVMAYVAAFVYEINHKVHVASRTEYVEVNKKNDFRLLVEVFVILLLVYLFGR